MVTHLLPDIYWIGSNLSSAFNPAYTLVKTDNGSLDLEPKTCHSLRLYLKLLV